MRAWPVDRRDRPLRTIGELSFDIGYPFCFCGPLRARLLMMWFSERSLVSPVPLTSAPLLPAKVPKQNQPKVTEIVAGRTGPGPAVEGTGGGGVGRPRGWTRSLVQTAAGRYANRMTLAQLREHLEATPFRPFSVRTVSGKTLEVNHSEYVWIPPRSTGDFLLVETNGAKHHLGIEYVEGIEVRPKAKSR